MKAANEIIFRSLKQDLDNFDTAEESLEQKRQDAKADWDKDTFQETQDKISHLWDVRESCQDMAYAKIKDNVKFFYQNKRSNTDMFCTDDGVSTWAWF